jgi:hypothetical protein
MAFAFSTTPTVGVGTISIARNGTTVTGVGTNFQSPSLVGQIILVNGFNSRVTAVASATSMTINRVPSFEIVGETFSFVAGTVNINQSGADTDPSGVSALLGVNTYRVGIQAVYDLGVLRLALTGAAATFSYDANRHCIVWSNQVVETELTIGSGRTLTITGARTDGTYTAPFYPRALAFPRSLPSDSSFIPARRSIVNNGTLNLSGIWVDGNQVSEINSVANITEVKWSSTDQQSNYRMNSGSITVNGMDLHNVALTLIQSAAALNGMRFYNSGYTPVSLPSVAPSNPRIYTDWNFLGALPLMNNFSGNANYVEFRNFGNWDGFRLATNAAVNMAARFVKNVSVNVLDTLGAGITGAIVYRLDTNNGSRVTYTADEHFIQTTVSGAATGRILALIGRLPVGAANNSTQYTAFMDCRNAANDQSGNDLLRYVSYEHLLSSRAINTKGIGLLNIEQTLFDDTNVTLDRTTAIAKLASSFTVDTVTKIVTVTANSSFDDLYDALKVYKATANALNLATPTLDSLILTPNGSTLEAFTGWSLVVNTGVTLSSGNKFKKVKFDTITLNGTALIIGTYEDSTGTFSRLVVNGLSNGMVVKLLTGSTILSTTTATGSSINIGYFIPTGSTAISATLYVEKATGQANGYNLYTNTLTLGDTGATTTAIMSIDTFYGRSAGQADRANVSVTWNGTTGAPTITLSGDADAKSVYDVVLESHATIANITYNRPTTTDGFTYQYVNAIFAGTGRMTGTKQFFTTGGVSIGYDLILNYLNTLNFIPNSWVKVIKSSDNSVIYPYTQISSGKLELNMGTGIDYKVFVKADGYKPLVEEINSGTGQALTLDQRPQAFYNTTTNISTLIPLLDVTNTSGVLSIVSVGEMSATSLQVCAIIDYLQKDEDYADVALYAETGDIWEIESQYQNTPDPTYIKITRLPTLTNAQYTIWDTYFTTASLSYPDTNITPIQGSTGLWVISNRSAIGEVTIKNEQAVSISQNASEYVWSKILENGKTANKNVSQSNNFDAITSIEVQKTN